MNSSRGETSVIVEGPYRRIGNRQTYVHVVHMGTRLLTHIRVYNKNVEEGSYKHSWRGITLDEAEYADLIAVSWKLLLFFIFFFLVFIVYPLFLGLG